MGFRGPIGVDALMNRRPVQISEPRPPKGLEKAELQEWRRVAGLLRSRGLLDALDQSLLTTYISLWATIQRLEAELLKRGELVEDGRGGLKRNPIHTALAASRTQYIAVLRELYMTPMARLRADIPAPIPKEKQSRVRELLAQGASLREAAEEAELDDPDGILD